MEITLLRPEFKNSITAPSSKSHLIRLIVCALLSERGARIYYDGSLSDDILAAVNCAEALGAEIRLTDGCITLIPPANLRQNAVLDCRSSGTVLRFFLCVCAVLGIKAELRFSEQLAARPHKPLIDALSANGAVIETEDACIRVVQGVSGTDFSVGGNISSQYISGLLLASCVHGSRITLTSPLQSADYVKMTEEVLSMFGCRTVYHCGVYTVPEAVFPADMTVCRAEGDFSNAAYALIGGAIGKKAVSVFGLNADNAQGDGKILRILKENGVKIEEKDDKITVFPSVFHGFSLSGADIPDLVPPLCVLASRANGDTVITDVERLKYKETDRIRSTVNLINSLGGKAEYKNGSLFIKGKELYGGKVNGENDHRTVMTATLAATVCENEVAISCAEAVNKSFPSFFSQFK